jgi:hypothetical protein
VSDQEPIATTRRLARLLGELTLITAGVLLALTADAGWNSRQERAQERDYLRSLRSEMLAARAEFDSDVATRESHRAVLDSLSSEVHQRDAECVQFVASERATHVVLRRQS